MMLRGPVPLKLTRPRVKEKGWKQSKFRPLCVLCRFAKQSDVKAKHYQNDRFEKQSENKASQTSFARFSCALMGLIGLFWCSNENYDIKFELVPDSNIK